MPPLPLTLDALLDALDARAARVVMPTAAAASFLRQQFAKRQAARGRAAWEQPDVLAWTQWTGSLWTETILAGHDDRLLLNALQEEALWRDLIAAATPGSLTPPGSLARLAQSAWALATSFRAAPLLRRTASTPDARIFAAWAETFRARCTRDRVLSAAELETTLEQHLREGRLRQPGRLIVCASPSITPAQTALLQALAATGTAVEPIHLISPDNNTAERLSTILPDERDELRFALRALRRFLSANPGSRAALLVPDLATESPTLEPLLLELLAPELTPVDLDASSTPWQLSSGRPLAHAPIVAAVLELARWAQGALPLDRIGALLLSPHLCPATERDHRAHFLADTLARQLLLRPELDLPVVLRLARGPNPELATWLSRVTEAAAHLSAAPPRRTFADWAEALRDLARAAGWPGERNLTAAEQAAADAYDAVLDLIATLDFQGKRVLFREACDAVQAQAARAPIPAASPDAPLQILSPEQATGLTFDFTVLLRATDDHLPPPAHAHPLLDWSLQRDHRMPGAHPAADDTRAHDSFAALLAGSPNILATSAAHNAEGALRPSPLLAAHGLRPIEAATWLPPEPPQPPVEEWLVEDTTPLPLLPSHIGPGGARLLKLQAACGFLAFAELRLGGRELETAEPGFDAVESGNVLHRALEIFWTATQSQARLRSMTERERDEALTQAIDQATNAPGLRGGSPWDIAYLAVQKERMRRLLTRWLTFELERGPFTILAMEQKQTVPVGPLELTVRIDRIDGLPDGGHVLVDYKTGLGAKPAAWEGDRPDEPQLPLYSLLGEEGELRAMAFARIRAGDAMGWAGHAAELGILPQKKQEDLDTRRSEWHDVLAHLAQDFHDGKADVQPKNPAVNCKRCAQRLLCRVEMASLLAQPDDTPAEDSLE